MALLTDNYAITRLEEILADAQDDLRRSRIDTGKYSANWRIVYQKRITDLVAALKLLKAEERPMITSLTL